MGDFKTHLDSQDWCHQCSHTITRKLQVGELNLMCFDFFEHALTSEQETTSEYTGTK